MGGFIGPSGRRFSNEQRMAMFARGHSPHSVMLVNVPRSVRCSHCGNDTKNKFAVGLALPLVALPAAATGAGLSIGGALAGGAAAGAAAGAAGLGASVEAIGAGASGLGSGVESIKYGATTISSAGGETIGSAEIPKLPLQQPPPKKSFFNETFDKDKIRQNVATGLQQEVAADIIKGGKAAIDRAANLPDQMIFRPVRAVGEVAGQGLGTGIMAATLPVGVGVAWGANMAGALSDLGEPAVPTNNQLIAMDVDGFGLPVFSMRPSNDIDVDVVRKLVKKQYPKADVDTEVEFLPPGKYTKVALEENPGRESEAVMSNGFYSPTKDKAYLEKGDKYNTLRALIHELVHDMSDEGVKEDYMINEGYADYVSYEIMTQEVGIPKQAAWRTLGYPKEAKTVAGMVNKYGRENVDRAFLKDHTLEVLDPKLPLLVSKT